MERLYGILDLCRRRSGVGGVDEETRDRGRSGVSGPGSGSLPGQVAIALADVVYRSRDLAGGPNFFVAILGEAGAGPTGFRHCLGGFSVCFSVSISWASGQSMDLQLRSPFPCASFRSRTGPQTIRSATVRLSQSAIRRCVSLESTATTWSEYVWMSRKRRQREVWGRGGVRVVHCTDGRFRRIRMPTGGGRRPERDSLLSHSQRRLDTKIQIADSASLRPPIPHPLLPSPLFLP